jgi:thiamine pyrophosphokinase
VKGIKTQNLKYQLNDEELHIGYRTGSSNEVLNDGMVVIEHREGDLLMMECFDL